MRSGFVSIVGRPNAGKSTLLNALVGERVAIVTSKPQTTRNRIAGVVEVPAKGSGHSKRPAAHIVFVDTPGVHQAGTQLDKRMLQEVYEALETRDVVILLVDASRELRLDTPQADVAAEQAGAAAVPADDQAEARETAPAIPESSTAESSAAESSTEEEKSAPSSGAKSSKNSASEDEFVFSLVRKLDCPVFLVLNKIDRIDRKKLLPMIESLTKQHPFTEVFPISARKRDGLDALVDRLIDHLPEGQRYFPKDQYTDQPERFLVAELIRERILMETGEEVPYASAVVIERFEDPPPAPPAKKSKPRAGPVGAAPESKLPLTRISAAIYCERDGQKAILIGKGGAKLKAIGTSARKEIESLLGTRVYLELHVIVQPGWRESRGFVDSLDWRRQLEDIAARQGAIEGALPDPLGASLETDAAKNDLLKGKA